MRKLIAVCGAPNCGKTVAALKLSQELYGLKSASVLYISPDLSVPCMAYLFPKGKDSDLYSLGEVLNKTDICREDLMKVTVNVRTMKNFGILGFKLGENRYSYPHPTEDKVIQLFASAGECAEYVIVDCSCDPDDMISAIAKRDCDVAVQMFNPDMKSFSYYGSCVNQFLMIKSKKLKVLNVMDKDVYAPIHETAAYFHGMDFILPYERMLKQQIITGTAAERLPRCQYRAEIEKLAKAVM